MLNPHLRTLKNYYYSDFILVRKKLFNSLNSDLKIRFTYKGTEPDFFNFSTLCSFGLSLGLFLFRVSEFAEIDNFSYRRHGVGCNLNQGKPFIFSLFYSFVPAHFPYQLTITSHDSKLVSPNLIICS